ncbi:MAG TPA: MauE/DoxX family redox-associated membrane protein [Euzebya sp.]|nr:MauE/DoxX family redox-associated membrane protein [Euzebya sp.]
MDPQPIVTAVVWLAAGLLAVAGAAKLTVPDAAMATLHSLRLPSGRIAARMLGLGEIVVGVAVVLVGGLPAAIVLVVAYAALLAVAGRQRAKQLDCGCFGVAAAPISTLHLGLNAGATVAGLVGVVWAPLALAAVAADAGLLATAAGLVLLATGVGLVRAVVSQTAEALRSNPPRRRSEVRA